jgi:hypothetical protein
MLNDTDLKELRHYVIWLATRRINKWKKNRIWCIELSILDTLQTHGEITDGFYNITEEQLHNEAKKINKLMLEISKIRKERKRESLKKWNEELKLKRAKRKDYKENFTRKLRDNIYKHS